MLTAIAVFGVALCCSVILTPAVRHVAVRCGRFDHAFTSRKIHTAPVPRLGGLAIIAAFALPLFVWSFAHGPAEGIAEHPDLALAFLGGGALVAALGVYDDLVGVGARGKLLFQFAAALLAWNAGIHIDAIDLPIVGTIQLGVLSIPLTLFWIAGVTNAMNLIDGMDGLAGGVALIALASLGAIAFVRGDAMVVLLAAALGGAVLGFLFFNWSPASIFMGDTGSMFLGYVLAITALRVAHDERAGVSLLVPVVALAVPIADTLLAITRRVARGAPVFVADRGHIHHRLLALGLSQRRAAGVLYAVCACLGAVAIVLARSSDTLALSVLVLLAAAAVLTLRWLGTPDHGLLHGEASAVAETPESLEMQTMGPTQAATEVRRVA